MYLYHGKVKSKNNTKALILTRPVVHEAICNKPLAILEADQTLSPSLPYYPCSPALFLAAPVGRASQLMSVLRAVVLMSSAGSALGAVVSRINKTMQTHSIARQVSTKR
jgi:hypothetical protein